MVGSGSCRRNHWLLGLGLLLFVAAPLAANDPPGIGYNRGDIAPELTLTDQNDEEVSLSHFRGKNLLLLFSASWCPPCQYAAPIAEELIHELNDDGEPSAVVEVLVQNEYGDPSETIDAQYWADDFGLTSPVLSLGGDPYSPAVRQFLAYARKYGGPAFPTAVLLTPHGRIVNVYVGFSASRIRSDFERHRAYEPRCMVDWLLTAVERLRPSNDLSKRLAVPLQAALAALDVSEPDTACAQLTTFIAQVNSQDGKGLSKDQATQLMDQTARIQAMLECPE